MHALPQVERFMAPLPRELAERRLRACELEWSERGHGLVAVVDGATGRFLGRAGLRYWPQFDETELGWVLHPDVWGCGYATEAARACADWGFQNLDIAYLTAMIHPGNSRSIKVAQRLGMQQLRTDVLLDQPVVVHCLTREQHSS